MIRTQNPFLWFSIDTNTREERSKTVRARRKRVPAVSLRSNRRTGVGRDMINERGRLQMFPRPLDVRHMKPRPSLLLLGFVEEMGHLYVKLCLLLRRLRRFFVGFWCWSLSFLFVICVFIDRTLGWLCYDAEIAPSFIGMRSRLWIVELKGHIHDCIVRIFRDRIKLEFRVWELSEFHSTGKF